MYFNAKDEAEPSTDFMEGQIFTGVDAPIPEVEHQLYPVNVRVSNILIHGFLYPYHTD